MTTAPKIGETFTTAKSGVSGKVEEVVKNANGSLRVRLDVGGNERWTTIKQFNTKQGQFIESVLTQCRK